MRTKLLNNLFLSGVLLISCGLFQNCAKDEIETTGIIYGIVNDSDNGEPVQDAHIMLSPYGKAANTGSDGSYEFPDLEPGQYIIQISRTGYKTNTKRITVVAGEKASGDMMLKRGISAIRLSTASLNFGSQSTSKTFTIQNISTSGKSILWGVSKASSANWLSVTPANGSTASAKESTIVVNIDRSRIKKDETTILLIDAEGESLSVEVSVSKNEDGEGDGSQPDGGSCGVITPWDMELKTEFVGCIRIGSTVEFRFNVTNVAEDVKLTFKSYEGIDNKGNKYDSSNSEFKVSNKTANILPFLFPRNVPIPGQVILKNVPSNVYSVARFQIVIEKKSEPWSVLNTELKFEDVKW
ncbi:carboxypeptidase regulatory-like domain-containing protein [Bacteroides faecium]|uniref:BACON domain-containing protein n=1 Tax=Bacteroides faecium TaxID=2715212 RepID=A0A6H0KK50_9BACE|nr:carboxypeptidase regulatory-like domain-containing protein [Bacteroides faecium]QIU93401.1 hypothetical protein BacF7301_04190 [Bacteroides faecium]